MKFDYAEVFQELDEERAERELANRYFEGDLEAMFDFDNWHYEKMWADCYRADGDCVCQVCGTMYRQHPVDPQLSYDGQPFLRRLCNGDRVKL